jgi:plastocyanin
MRRAAVLTVLAALALPASAHAATKVVYAGPPLPLKGTPRAAELDRFFRGDVTIRAGDRVRWEFKGPHNVTFLKEGATAAPAFVDPQVIHPYARELDAAGKPFWFSGTFPTLTLGAEMLKRTKGASYDGSALRESGVPLVEPGPPRPYTLRFPKPGTYTYYCLLHPGVHNAFDGMRATVTVLPKGAKVPSGAADRAALARELADSRTEARRNDRFKGPADPLEVQAGNDDPDGTTLRHFYPATRTVKVGDTVTFRIDLDSFQFHTVSFGPKDYLKKQAARLFVAKRVGPGPKKFVVSPNIFLGSEPLKLVLSPAVSYEFPPPPAYDGTNHGNGFLSSVGLDIDTTTPNPDTTRIQFTKAGTYTYYCLVHFPAMTGKIVVQP